MLDIIITTYNNPDKLELLLASIKAQFDYNFIVTVVNDGSDSSYDDCYSEVIKSYDTFEINYIKNDHNIGPGLSRQVGVDNSYEDYFIFVDSDDRLLPFATQVINNAIVSNNSPSLIVSKFYVNDHGNLVISKSVNQIATWHHGKVYNRNKVRKYSIKVPEEFSYVADDCYFNAVALELLSNKGGELGVPFYVWDQNDNSLTHTRNLKDEDKNLQVLKALISAANHILNYVPSLSLISCALNRQINLCKDSLTEDLKTQINKLGLCVE